MVESINELRKICYKGSTGKRPLYMQFVTMKVSIYITKLLLYTPIRADHVTISMVLMVILGSAFLAYGTLLSMLIGILIIHFTIILDNVNGEVARYRKEGNMRGSFLEFFFHEIAAIFIFFSFSYGIFLQTGYKSILIFGFLCSVFSRSVVLGIVKLAAVKHGLRDDMKKRKVKLKKCIDLVGKPNIKGGASKTGQTLYNAYDYIKELWGHPFNIIHINIIIIFEIANSYYHVIPMFLLSYLYLSIYAVVSIIIQIMSFIVHYRGQTVYHYYITLFGRK